MTTSTTRRRLVAAAFACRAATVAGPAMAADVSLLCAGAMKAPVTRLVGANGADVGVDARYATAGAIRERLAAGERPDVVIAPAADITRLVVAGLVDASTRRPLGSTSIGLAVRADAPLPDVTTVEALRETLLAARRVVIVDPTKGTSGQLVMGTFERLGIVDAMKPKTLMLDGGYVVEAVARGDADLGLHQVSEILPVAGVRLVGRLPRELDQHTRYDAAILTSSAHRAAAEALLRTLVDARADGVLEAGGFTVEH